MMARSPMPPPTAIPIIAPVCSTPLALLGGGEGGCKPNSVVSKINGTPETEYVAKNDEGNVINGDWIMASNAWITCMSSVIVIILDLGIYPTIQMRVMNNLYLP